MNNRFAIIGWTTICLLAGSLPILRGSVLAASSVPPIYLYSGYLMTASGNPLSGPYRMRFSYWNNPDALAGDLLTSGEINPAAAGYLGWQEADTVIPGNKGAFTVYLGSQNPLPSFGMFSSGDLSTLHLQVEVRPENAPDTSYELMDPDVQNQALDRSPVPAAPFATNALLLDRRGIGTGSGSVPLLLSGGMLPVSAIPGKTNADSFTIDADASSTQDVSLKFGETLGKTLAYDVLGSRFVFNADLHIQGNLTVTGLVNGVNLSAIASGTGSVLAVLHPEFAAAYQGDGENNVGQLSVRHDGGPRTNYYAWTSSRSSLQDYDVIVRLTLPQRFERWSSTPIVMNHRTQSASAGDGKLDLLLFDTAGNAVGVNGGSGLASASWAAAGITFSGSPTWTPGQSFLLKVKFSSKNGIEAALGDIEFRYVERVH